MTKVLEHLVAHADQATVSKTTVIQLCEKGGGWRGADYSLGIVRSSAENLSFVRQAVETWAGGQCVPGAEEGSDWTTVTFRVPFSADSSTGDGKNSRFGARDLDGPCTTIRVVGGDSCDSLASKCGIGPDEFM